MSGNRKWKRLAAWLLTFAMVFGDSSIAVLAEEASTETVVQEATETDALDTRGGGNTGI